MFHFKVTVGKADVWGAAVGFFAAVGQVVLLRESLSTAGGNESATSISFVGWFLGVAFGAFIAKRILFRFGTPFVMSALSCCLVVLGFALLKLHRSLLCVSVGEEPAFIDIAVVLVTGLGLGGLATGSLFTTTALRFDDEARSPVSRLYAAESFGAVLGTAVFYFILVHCASHLTDIAVVSASLFLCALPMSAPRMRIASALFSAIVIGAIATGGLYRIDSTMEQRAFRSLRASRLIASTTSAYGRVSIAEQSGEYEVLIDGRFDHSFPDPYDRPVPIHIALTAHPNPKDILILGGGPTDRLEAALAHHPKHVVMTYLNDKIESLCRPYRPASTMSALRDSRVETVEDDGRRYVKNTKERFDVVIIATRPPRSAAENRFYTENFYREVSRILKKGGIVTAVAAGGENVLSEEAAQSAASTLKAIQTAFQSTLVLSGLDTLILASDDKNILNLNATILAKRYRQRNVRAPSFSASRFEDLMDVSRMRERTKALQRIHPEVNTDEHPVVYSAGLSLWERSLGPLQSTTAKVTITYFLIRHAAWFFLIPTVLLLGLGLYSLKRRVDPSTVASTSIAVTGAAGMASQIVVMFAFQAVFGTLYVALALLTGMFMLGLAIGAVIGRKFFAFNRTRAFGRTRRLVIVDGALVVFLSITGIAFEQAIQTASVFYAWSACGGVLTGAAFPAFLNSAARSRSRDERIAAPAIEFADHIGAAFGAFVTGLIWVPAFGMMRTCLLFAGLKLASMTGCIVIGRNVFPMDKRASGE